MSLDDEPDPVFQSCAFRQEPNPKSLVSLCSYYPTDQVLAFKLIEQGIDLNETNENGETALILLCKRGIDSDNLIISKLLESKCDVNVKNNYGTSALWMAAGQHNIEAVNKLIDYKAEVYHEGCFNNFTPLRFLCLTRPEDEEKHFKTIIRLLDETNLIELENKDQSNRTIMYYIYRFRSPNVLNYLKSLYRNSVLESIADGGTIIGNCCVNPICDLNIVDILIDFVY